MRRLEHGGPLCTLRHCNWYHLRKDGQEKCQEKEDVVRQTDDCEERLTVFDNQPLRKERRAYYMGMVLARVRVHKALGCCPTQRQGVGRHMVSEDTTQESPAQDPLQSTF